MRAATFAPGAAVALSVVALLAPASVSGQSVEARAEVGVAVRAFPQAPLFTAQTSAALSPSILVAPELEWASDGGTWRVYGEGFARIDAHDGNRTHVDVRELGVTWLGEGVTAFAGMGQVFWGVTEVRHLVDIVNQIDAVEDVDGEDRLGQPMVAATLEGDWGVLDLYGLPYARERIFPEEDARLRGPLPVGEAVYTSGRGRWSPSFAARYVRIEGPVDVGVTAFFGTAREPRFEPGPGEDGAPVLRPVYDEIDQFGLDAQWTGERTLLKLEAMTRGGHAERIVALTGGLETTLYQVFGSAGDLGLLAEVMLDSRGAGAPPTLFDNDLFVGGRWALNDVAGTSVLGGPIVDWETGEILFMLEAERRFGASWHLSVDARLFGNTDPGSVVHGIRRDGFVSVALSRFF
ncbi:MAG TPA: hypothetical protein VK858_21490 [Longimicrobiales bacterium]|nr:hypothetical protein [Longimicrobiales bacterium]